MELHAWASSNVAQNNNMNTLGFIAQPQYQYKNDNYTNYYESNHFDQKLQRRKQKQM